MLLLLVFFLSLCQFQKEPTERPALRLVGIFLLVHNEPPIGQICRKQIQNKAVYDTSFESRVL